MAGDAGACVAAAREVLPSLPAGASAARTAAQGLSCALDLEDEADRRKALAALEPRARKELGAKGVLADDRSWLYDVLSKARAEQGDEAGAKALAERWLSFVEAEAAKARTPAARSALDGQRVSAALRLGAPARALPAVQASARDLPDDFVPPSLLAVLYLELGRPGDALGAAERALALAKGPRRVRVLVLEASALERLGRTAEARAALEQGIREGEAMPEAARPTGWIARAKDALRALPEG
jgi:predicted Zn-dependent protease